MALARKAYRIEAMLGVGALSEPTNGFGADAILHELNEIKKLVKPQQEISKDIIADYQKQFTEAYKLKNEMETIQEAISRTKQEIASLHVSGFKGEDMSRVTDELDAVVRGTEQATESILSAVEKIDDDANNLVAHLKGDRQAMAADIQERVLAIYEACNFQDLTGQRITKVVKTLKYIEARINAMIEIWGPDNIAEIVPKAAEDHRDDDSKLLNGPALENQGISQDEIDALFG